MACSPGLFYTCCGTEQVDDFCTTGPIPETPQGKKFPSFQFKINKRIFSVSIEYPSVNIYFTTFGAQAKRIGVLSERLVILTKRFKVIVTQLLCFLLFFFAFAYFFSQDPSLKMVSMEQKSQLQWDLIQLSLVYQFAASPLTH